MLGCASLTTVRCAQDEDVPASVNSKITGIARVPMPLRLLQPAICCAPDYRSVSRSGKHTLQIEESCDGPLVTSRSRGAPGATESHRRRGHATAAHPLREYRFKLTHVRIRNGQYDVNGPTGAGSPWERCTYAGSMNSFNRSSTRSIRPSMESWNSMASRSILLGGLAVQAHRLEPHALKYGARSNDDAARARCSAELGGRSVYGSRARQ